VRLMEDKVERTEELLIMCGWCQESRDAGPAMGGDRDRGQRIASFRRGAPAADFTWPMLGMRFSYQIEKQDLLTITQRSRSE
jgi:hypothetical protein